VLKRTVKVLVFPEVTFMANFSKIFTGKKFASNKRQHLATKKSNKIHSLADLKNDVNYT